MTYMFRKENLGEIKIETTDPRGIQYMAYSVKTLGSKIWIGGEPVLKSR